jgi:uncharacterized membrane protein
VPEASPSKLSLVHRTWLAVAFLMGLMSVAIYPPFEINDESQHWTRMWTVIAGQVNCRTIPEAASRIVRRFERGLERERAEYLHEMFDHSGTTHPMPAGVNTCTYYPGPYLLQGIVGRLFGLDLHGRPTRGGMMRAFYAVRTMNWLVLCAVTLWAMLALPWLRSLLLVFLSLPEVVMQTICIGTDAFLFPLTIALIVLLFARVPTWKTVIWIGVVTLLMALTKPFLAALALVAAPIVVRLRRDRGGLRAGHVILLAAMLILPSLAWIAWSRLCVYKITQFLPPWHVDPVKQTAFLKAHPLHIFRLFWYQLGETFKAHNLMHGGWTSILGGFGWSDHEMSRWAYYALLLALGLACAADYANAAPVETRRADRADVVAWGLALSGLAIQIPAIVIGCYLTFQTVASPEVNGVEGRYYLIPFLLLIAIAIHLWRWRRPASLDPRITTALTIAAMLLCLAADVAAIQCNRAYYYSSL